MCFSSCIYTVSMSMNISISMSMSMRCMDTNCVTILYSMSLQNEHPEIYKRGKCVQCINSTRSMSMKTSLNFVITINRVI